jgi:hypothetical protein
MTMATTTLRQCVPTAITITPPTPALPMDITGLPGLTEASSSVPGAGSVAAMATEVIAADMAIVAA